MWLKATENVRNVAFILEFFNKKGHSLAFSVSYKIFSKPVKWIIGHKHSYKIVIANYFTIFQNLHRTDSLCSLNYFFFSGSLQFIDGPRLSAWCSTTTKLKLKTHSLGSPLEKQGCQNCPKGSIVVWCNINLTWHNQNFYLLTKQYVTYFMTGENKAQIYWAVNFTFKTVPSNGQAWKVNGEKLIMI